MSYTVTNPATEETVTTVAHVTAAETDHAIARATRAQRRWAALTPADQYPSRGDRD
ncbi:aldehyde dehydrogenase family protein [Lysinibacter sp. HNR]|uniref:aldehyde dehydrogenase family protein n=1 Tax=Lysinibacter sp. HNR TaxID=3031408 RepID=UPI00243613B7|nr:aldehyde dehydrogenase family protein [Lysinibacter sp. HNR]WGD37202.1 aldehyde dehydrogenase family protein [Lysinibacter sp. HNR]